MPIDILNTYYLLGLWRGLSPVPSFFKDRYFPTAPTDIFDADKVLVEYQDGDNQMAPFLVERAEPIAVARQGYEIHEYSPTMIGNKRDLTLDDLKKRGFGEAILPNSTEAQRATRYAMEDMDVLTRRLNRTEEWLCAQTILNNGFTVNEMVTKDLVGNVATVQFYDPTKGNDGIYTIGQGYKWDDNGITWAKVVATVRAMCRGLSQRGLAHTDLLCGIDAIDALLALDEFKALVDKNSGIAISSGIEAQLSDYDGVTFYGQINFGGYKLNVISVDEQYVDANGQTQNHFPKNSICVTAPGAGHLMYAKITQIVDKQFQTIADKRVPRLFIDERHDTREIWLRARPFAAPKNYSPWVVANNIVS